MSVGEVVVFGCCWRHGFGHVVFFVCEWFARVHIVIDDDAIAYLKAVVRSRPTPLRCVRLHSRLIYRATSAIASVALLFRRTYLKAIARD